MRHAHTAMTTYDSLSRPCKRCVSVGKDDTCRDVEHKKRGRPKLVDKTVAIDGAWAASGKDGSAPSVSKAATALAKTRVKGKYTKSANYKLPKKMNTAAKIITETYAVPQITTQARDTALDVHGRPSSYPSRLEQERPASSMSHRSQPPSQNYQNRPLSMHSEPPLPGDHQDPFYYSSSYPQSTSQIKHPQDLYSAPSSAPMATAFLTMDLICARVSDESQALWGYHPHDISHKSLCSIVANEDQSKLRNLLGLIKDAIFSAAPRNASLSRHSFLESTSQVFYQNRPGIMSSSAPGSSEYTDVIRVCHVDGGSDLFSIRIPNDRFSAPFGSSASNVPLSSSSGSSSSSSSSYTVPLSKLSSQSSSLPSLRTGPLHTARWLYDSEPFAGPGHLSHHSPSHRLPAVFADPFRTLSAPMGGFGVSKYLNRFESNAPFNSIRRHQLPLPSSSSLQSSTSASGTRLDLGINRTPRSLQRDLSSSSLGASFGSRSPPLSMKRPLADMADSQDRNRDIDNRHQDHHQRQQQQQHSHSHPLQHQNSRSGPNGLSLLSTSLPSPSNGPSRPGYQQSIKLELQTMPPDHPAIDPSSAGVCPIVHGSQQRGRVQQQAQLQASQVERERGRIAENDPTGCHGYGHERDADTLASACARKSGYFDSEQSGLSNHLPHSPGSHGACPVGYTGDSMAAHFGTQDEERAGNGAHAGLSNVNPFSTGPSSPTESYSHHRDRDRDRTGVSLRRTSSVGRSSYINRSKGGPVVCLSGACGAVCRCSGEDEETRAVKAMDAARKRMSVHSLLC
ncbi:hypothetical protein EDD11_005853 [Mortierella claussenii]|nr:hypothetical protein EDD11_005853 [Mortierella claussenii]